MAQSSRPVKPVVASSTSRAPAASRRAQSAERRSRLGSPIAGGTVAPVRGDMVCATSALAATLHFDITSAKGRPLSTMCLCTTSSVGSTASSSEGNRCHGISMASSRRGVMRPISSCWGSSAAPPGSPRQVTIIRTGRRKVQVSEVSGLTALPSPEFWNMATAPRPPSVAPAAIATASPSLAAPT